MKLQLLFALVLGAMLPLAFSEQMIYKASANLNLAWAASVPNEGIVPPSKLNAFENSVSAYITEHLVAEEVTGLLAGKKLLVTTANVIDQQVDEESGFEPDEKAILALKLSVLLVYAGDEKIVGLDFILADLFAYDQQKEELLSILKDTDIVDNDTATSAVTASFSVSSNSVETNSIYTVNSDRTSSRSAADKSLIIACTFLSIALIFVSLVLLWVVSDTKNQRCTTFFRKRVENPFPNVMPPKYLSRDEDEDQVTSASGIIGANPNSDMENIPPGAAAASAKMTPHRGVFREDIMSPLSQNTIATNCTDTDVSRPPLGIRSIRKLARYTTPEKRQSTNPYHMSKLTYT